MKFRHFPILMFIPLCLLMFQIFRISAIRAQDAVPQASTYTLFLPIIGAPNNKIVYNKASSGSPIAINPYNSDIWVVNPDSNSISVINSVSFTKTIEIAVGKEPWSIALSPNGAYAYVVNRADGTLSFVDAKNLTVSNTLYIGSEPSMVVLNAAGDRAYVAVTAANEIVVVDTTLITVTTQIPVDALPYAIAISNIGDGNDQNGYIFVTHLLSFPKFNSIATINDDREAKVTQLSAKTNEISQVITLTSDIHGFPNLLTGIGITNGRVWIPHVRDSPALPNGLTTTVFAAVAAIDRVKKSENIDSRLLLNDEEVFGSPVNNPTAIAFSPDEQTMYVVLAGSNLVEAIDIKTPNEPKLLKFLPTGKNPRGIAISQDGRYGYTMNFMSRSITVLDLSSLEVITEVSTTAETLSSEILRGKKLFNIATDPRVSKGSWVSCASCHPDGGTDGVTWFFPDGPRQTPAIWNAGDTLPWHWSAALDEVQDVEETIEIIQHGIGLAPGEDPAQLGTPNTGRSADLDALSSYVKSGIRTPTVGSPADRLSVARGRQLFVSHQCAHCHGSTSWTISTLPGLPGDLDSDGNGMIDSVLRDVGTVSTEDLRGASGFDVPSLLDIGLTAPYLHNGSMPTLEALLHSGHPTPQSNENVLSDEEVNDLAVFLRTIDNQTEPIDIQ